MINDLFISLVSSDEDLETIIFLKNKEDNEITNLNISEEQTMNSVFELIEDYKPIFWIAKLKEVPVGYAMAREKNNSLESLGVFTLAEYRRRGIASQLKQEQINYAKEKEYKQIYTGVAKDNKASIELQLKFGFQQYLSSRSPTRYVLNL